MPCQDNLRLGWKRQQLPLLHALMEELRRGQQALLGRDLTALDHSMRQQIELAAKIKSLNHQVSNANYNASFVDHAASPQTPPSMVATNVRLPAVESSVPEIQEDLAAHRDAINSQFQSAIHSAQREARVQGAFLRRSLATVQALSNTFAMNAGTYARPTAELVASFDPADLAQHSASYAR